MRQQYLKKSYKSLFLLLLFAFVLILLNLLTGEISLKYQQLLLKGIDSEVFWNFRLPKAISACCAGAALGLAGQVMQTYFNNPIAGPYVLGVSSSSTLCVAIWIMGTNILPLDSITLVRAIGIAPFSILGAFLYMLLLLLMSKVVRGKVILLILGMLFSQFSAGVLSLIMAFSKKYQLQEFFLWNLGSFQKTSGTTLLVFIVLVFLCFMVAMRSVRDFNAVVLGDHYAESLGVNLINFKNKVILLVAVLSGAVTAFCGPIAFIGIIAPHIFRRFVKTSRHQILFPGVMLTGSILALLAELIISVNSHFSIHINIVLGLMGAPIIFIYLLKREMKI